MRSGDIQDSDITASSARNSDSYPFYARLDNAKAWHPDRNDTIPWIQVNLQQRRNITAIATQGFRGWYYVTYGDDGRNWMNYTVQGTIKVLR